MIIAGTGHRPPKLGGYSDFVYARLIRLAQGWLREHKPKLVISGGALGWDTALTVAAYMECIQYEVAVPFIGQESMWPKAAQERYNKMCEGALNVRIICPGGYSPSKMQARNEWMVNHCDLVLALWDGSKGGTANCIEYAERVGKPIQNLWSSWRSI